jgi:hypothetical protein
MAVNMEIMIFGIVWYIGTIISRFRAAGTQTGCQKANERWQGDIFSPSSFDKVHSSYIETRFSFIRSSIKN